MLIAAALSLTDFAPVLGIAAVTALVMLRLQARRQRLAKPARNAPSSLTESQRPPRAVERWETELFDYCREVEGRLDAKIAALQRLVIDADARIAHLESLGLDEPPRTAPTSIGEPLAGPHFAEPQARQAAVHAMADAGQNAAAIANRLTMTIAEVEALLRLRGVKRPSDG